jgi:hypothetical protein
LLQFSRKNPPETSLRYQQMQAALNRLLLADAFPTNLPVKSWRPLQNLVAIKY